MKPIPTLCLAVAILPCAAAPFDETDRFQINARLSFNARVSFGGIGGAAAATDPGPVTGGGLNRNYDDGYVRRDADGNAGGVSWNWGYRDAAQIPGNDTLRLNSTSAVADGRSSAGQKEPAPGYEIAWLHQLHHNDRWAGGLKLGFGYSDYEFRDSAAVASTAFRLTDIYSLGGIIPPGDPTRPGYQYAGTADLPGPVIDDTPFRRERSTLGALTTGTRRLDASLWSFKLGTWVEAPLCNRVSVQLGGGFAFGVVDASYSFDETTTVPGVGPIGRSGWDSGAAVLFGGYLEGLLNTHLTDQIDFVVGIGFSAFNSYRDRLASRPVSVDFGTTWNIQAGFSFSF